jgi:uncharacterized protein YbaA (DUF1428 family)
MKKKDNYVDGFVLVVPKSKTAAYKKMASEAGKIWKKFGALDYKECIIEDPKPKWVKLTFGKLMKAKKTDTIWYSFITYKSRQHRDQVNKKVMASMDKDKDKYKDLEMPFDMNRMAYGGFKAMVNL